MSELNLFDIKFHHDITHNNFIFMGFSFDDLNISYLIHILDGALALIPMYWINPIIIFPYMSPICRRHARKSF